MVKAVGTYSTHLHLPVILHEHPEPKPLCFDDASAANELKRSLNTGQSAVVKPTAALQPSCFAPANSTSSSTRASTGSADCPSGSHSTPTRRRLRSILCQTFRNTRIQPLRNLPLPKANWHQQRRQRRLSTRRHKQRANPRHQRRPQIHPPRPHAHLTPLHNVHHARHTARARKRVLGLRVSLLSRIHTCVHGLWDRWLRTAIVGRCVDVSCAGLRIAD